VTGTKPDGVKYENSRSEACPGDREMAFNIASFGHNWVPEAYNGICRTRSDV